jgi:hypothetical protein
MSRRRGREGTRSDPPSALTPAVLPPPRMALLVFRRPTMRGGSTQELEQFPKAGPVTSLSGRPPHVPFGHGRQPLGPFLTHEKGLPFTCVQPSGASLGRFGVEAGRFRPLLPVALTPPVARAHVWGEPPGHHRVYADQVQVIHLCG